MGTTETAAVTAVVFAAMLVGHHVADRVVQSATTALAKAAPPDDRIAAGTNPWAGWSACARNTATTALIHAVALALAWIVAPLTAPGATAALTLGAAFHAVIDRRWIVQIIRRHRGDDRPDGPDLTGQALHYGAYLTAAAIAATVTTPAGWAATAGIALATVVAAMVVERHRARTAADRIGDPYRL